MTGATNVDFSLGNVVKMTLTGDAVLTVTNPPTTGLSGRIRLAITGNGSATLGITNVVWGAAGTPSTIASGKTLMVTMDTLNGGGNWLAGWDLFSPTAPPPPPPPTTIGSWANVHPQTDQTKLIASSVSGDLTMRAGFPSVYSDGSYNSFFFVGLAGSNAEFPTSGNHAYEYGSNSKFSTIISPSSGQRVVLDHFKFVARIEDASSNPTAQVWVNGAPAFTSSVLSAFETALDVDLSAVGPFSVDEVVTVAVTSRPAPALPTSESVRPRAT